MMLEENKILGTIAVTSLITIFSIYALQYLLQAITPRVAEAVEYPEPYGMLWLTPAGHIMNVSYGAGEEPEYFGEALPGTLDSDAYWRIYRYEYSMVGGDLEIAKIRFASGDTNFDKIWDDREDYDYS